MVKSLKSCLFKISLKFLCLCREELIICKILQDLAFSGFYLQINLVQLLAMS